MSLKDQVAVVTGASSGIGAATARELARAGCRVALGARRVDRLRAVCAEIEAEGGIAVTAPTDMRDERQVEALIARAVEAYGRLDLLVNNAAFGTVRTIATGDTDEWRAILETNVLGTLFACRAALVQMLPHRAGTIINVTSASAYEAWPYLSVYAGSKAAVHAISRGLRAEAAPQGIRVMTVEIHNVTGTDFAAGFDPTILAEAMQRWHQLGLLTNDSPMIEPEDVARSIAFMAAQVDPVSIHHLSIRSRAN